MDIECDILHIAVLHSHCSRICTYFSLSTNVLIYIPLCLLSHTPTKTLCTIAPPPPPPLHKNIVNPVNTDKALTDTSKFVLAWRFDLYPKVFLKGYERRSKVRQLCTTSCSECVHKCVNRSGVGVNAQMRHEDSRTLTRQRGSKRGGNPERREKERERVETDDGVDAETSLSLSLCISISLLRSYTFFSRSPLVSKTLLERERARELNRESQWRGCECANERGELNAVRVVAEHSTRIPFQTRK